MKRIGLLLSAILFVTALSAQTSGEYQPSFFVLGANDTMSIVKGDKISGVTIVVPAAATDSVWVTGTTATLDGFTSGTLKLAPGNSIALGYNDRQRINGVAIISKNSAYIITSPGR